MKFDFKKISGDIKNWTMKNSPEILVGVGLAGFTFAIVDAIKVTPLAIDLIEQKKEELEVDELPVTEKVKATWKVYIPVVISAGISTACIIGGHKVSAKRNAVLATAYALSETTLKEYRQKVVDTIGEKKEKIIRDDVAKDHMEAHPLTQQPIIITQKGDTLCFDSWSGRYFKSDIDQIKKIVNELNEELIKTSYVSLNELYFKLGLQCTEMGNELGWSMSEGLIDISYSYHGAEDGTPCLVLEYGIKPRFDYCRFS